jgi:hypothetical protein
MEAAMSEMMTAVFSCGAAMMGRKELPSVETMPMMAALARAMPMPAGRWLARSPRKMRAASEMLKMMTMMPDIAPAKRPGRTRTS